MSKACVCDQCGTPVKGDGTPPKGWVRFTEHGSSNYDFCGWECVRDFAVSRALLDDLGE